MHKKSTVLPRHTQQLDRGCIVLKATHRMFIFFLHRTVLDIPHSNRFVLGNSNSSTLRRTSGITPRVCFLFMCYSRARPAQAWVRRLLHSWLRPRAYSRRPVALSRCTRSVLPPQQEPRSLLTANNCSAQEATRPRAFRELALARTQRRFSNYPGFSFYHTT